MHRTMSRDAARIPWTQLWIDALPIAPAWIGCAFAAGHMLLGALCFAVFATPHTAAAWPTYQETLLSTSIFALLIGYATGALAYARAAHEAGLRDLQPALDCSDAELSELRREVLRFDMPTLRRAGLIAALGAVAATYFTTDVAQRLELHRPALLWVLWQNALTFWLLTRTIAHDLRVSSVFSQAAQRHAQVDLFDLAPVAPLARRGLQSALLIVLATSLFSLIFGVGDISPLVPAMQTATVMLAVFALARPSLGIRRRVRAAKREELARVSLELRAVRAQRAATPGADWREADSRLATLLALKQHIETTREWPFDVGTLGRFLLYVVIGVGSWLGAAAVERLLNLLLG
jgi:hypothetical protein